MIRNYLLGFFAISTCFIAPTVARQAIVGGYIAQANQFPYQVSVQLNNQNICGGGIITAEFILTAAHCVFKKGHFLDKRLFVLAGTHDLHKPVEPNQLVKVKYIYVPEEYIQKEQLRRADIAVLKLVHALEVARTGPIQKLNLPLDTPDRYANKNAVIAGFGWYRTDGHPYLVKDGTLDHRLRYAHVKVQSDEICRIDVKNWDEISERNICARVDQHIHGHPSGVCLGDSGSPLVGANRVVLGILNTGSSNCQELTFPGIYTRVANYEHFIRSAVKDEPNPSVRKYEIKV